MYENTNRVDMAFCMSDAPLSRSLCRDLDSKGPIGQLASLLFKAEKAAMQAKSYVGKAPVSGRPYRNYSQDRMREMLAKAVSLLDAHAVAMGVTWGWSRNDAPGKPPWILCIDLPTGQVTYRVQERHLEAACELESENELLNSSLITKFCAGVLKGTWMVMEDEARAQSTPPTVPARRLT